MAIGIVFNESSVFLTVEDTEGTYKAPTSATEAVEVLSDGIEFNKTREPLERNTMGGTVETEAARVGIADIVGSVPVEYRASSTEGDAPASMDVLLRSLLGGKRQITSDQTSDDTSHTSTTIFFSDTSAFSVGDIVLVKEAGAYEVRPISAITTDTSITFPFALDNGAPANEVVVAKTTTYFSNTSDSVSFSAENNLGSEAIKQKVAGLRSASMSIEDWNVGQIPKATFSIQGTSLEREDADASYTPDFTADGQPPVTLSACAWIGGNKMEYTELSLSIENEINYIQSACSESGRIGTRLTSQTTNVNINPYMDDSDLTQTWDKFNDNDNVSFFAYAYNPTSTDGEFEEIVAVWLPQARILEAPVGNQDGIVTENLSIRAHRESGNDSVYLGFI